MDQPFSHSCFFLNLRSHWEGTYHFLVLFHISPGQLSDTVKDETQTSLVDPIYSMEDSCPHLDAGMSESRVEINECATGVATVYLRQGAFVCYQEGITLIFSY